MLAHLDPSGLLGVTSSHAEEGQTVSCPAVAGRETKDGACKNKSQKADAERKSVRNTYLHEEPPEKLPVTRSVNTYSGAGELSGLTFSTH